MSKRDWFGPLAASYLVLVAAGLGCDAENPLQISVILPVPDSITLFDTTFVSDSLVLVDTLHFARDSVSFAVGGFITDEDPTALELGVFDLPEHVPMLGITLSMEVELSGNGQKDEAFAVLVDGAVVTNCVVPDRPWLGKDRVFVGQWYDNRPLRLRAEHAILHSCYVPVDGFKTANSVHFHAVRFDFYRLVD